MTAWASDDLSKIGAAEELEIASLRRDGTLRHPVTIWVVRHGDDLYIRSVNGRTASWFRGTQVRHEGRIWAAVSRKTSPSWMPATTSPTNSTPRTAPSTAAMPPASSAPS